MNVEQLVDNLSRLAHQAGQAIEDKMNAQDISNPEAMLKAQFAVQQYSTFINYESAMLKTIKDMLSGIIAKI
ncbi:MULTISPECIES: type III secretion system needle filament subunit SctF [Morganella]|jgi:type III secretion protein F|uniref:Type III secretion system needle protein SsaG n=1 Tax=Morganella morganii TaxID=582 RepID=A0AAN5MEG2_MORMO|nr:MULTISPECIES: type III secretion system needle filament subunit SctF [Morganella]ELA9086392.1 type III secretion system needle protein SsaG [Morganella morganii]MCU6212968.1 type III secretion system needle protein SsaG [Morganella morganii]MCU6225535.1 type III secretion system needle protein SsaG [Morganella morganii]MCU6232654.1 type III secretion system needle protein SsaG [Morganella morganii]MCU6237499.1 type III secretion system needle protein SsaG [Morganella morganii]